MTRTDVSRSGRRRTLLTALLPLASALLLIAIGIGIAAIDTPLARFGTPSLLVPAAVIVACAYLSLLWGVAPLLIWFERRAWRTAWHYALAGYAGVVLPWLAVTVAVAVLRAGAAGRAASPVPWDTLIAGLSVPGAIAAAAAVVYWFACERRTHGA